MISDLNKSQISSTTKSTEKWASFTPSAMTEQLQKDLTFLGMRSAIDTKHFYKKKTFDPKNTNVQVGKVIPGALDFIRERLYEKKSKGETWVEELMKDKEKRKTIKERMKKVQTVHAGRGKGSYKQFQMKKNKFKF
ncbi:hypothetical protein O9G_005748 [Rozella allomycis CSF55]|uniref:Fcf2 pre-rRNA processing C-terminal domain-containing protein n=1 Tax=Rozella allomycis (strain CSF55) TaxID=988480 RepID=A0A075AVV0_ROZAC|nr:hypothetical protein O9G_005748 [Rozella allomycis CSF55]|eukprot:EPZ34448.1 hypothetical protein O9G_005748 [Rozella allomycis CSF55]